MAIKSSITVTRVLAVGALGAGLVLAACGSTPTNSAGSSTTNGTGLPSDSSQLSALTDNLKNAEKTPFKAVYTANNSGTTETVTIEQDPPKSFFSSGSGSVINTGTTTYFCSSSSGAQSCVSESASANPLASLVAFFNPATYVSTLQGLAAQAEAKVAGVNLSFSDATFAGQDSTCVTASHAGQSGKYCVTKAGILAYVGAAGSSFQLTSYSSSVTQSDFSLPAGATVETLPSGVSIPSNTP